MQQSYKDPVSGLEFPESTMKHELITLRKERDDARDAAAHFFHCLECGDGEYCSAGRQFALLLGLMSDEDVIEI